MKASTMIGDSARSILDFVIEQHGAGLPTSVLCDVALARAELTEPFCPPTVCSPAERYTDPATAIAVARQQARAASDQATTVADIFRYGRAARALGAAERGLALGRRR